MAIQSSLMKSVLGEMMALNKMEPWQGHLCYEHNMLSPLCTSSYFRDPARGWVLLTCQCRDVSCLKERNHLHVIVM